MERESKILCFIVITFLMMSFTEMSAKGTNPYELRMSSIKGDSIELYLYNNTIEPAYLFDTYLNKSDMAISSYLHRYNSDDGIVKLSFLPFQQFTILPLIPERTVLLGKGRYFRGNHQEYYHFTKIEAGDSLAITIARSSLSADFYYYDVDLKEYTLLEKAKTDDDCDEEKVKEKKDIKLKRVKNKPIADEITIELAVYRNIDLFLEYDLFKTLNYRYIRFNFSLRDLDEVASSYDIVSCSLCLRNIGSSSDWR